MFHEIGHPLGILLAQGSLTRIAYTLGDYPTAKRILEDNLRLAELIGNRRLIIQIRANDLLYTYAHDHSKQVAVLQQSFDFYKEQGDVGQVAWTLYEMGTIQLLDGHYEGAERCYLQCFPMFQEIYDFQGICWTSIWQATIALARNELDKAEQLVNNGLQAIEGLTFPWGVSGAHYVLGDIALARGNRDEAQRHFVEAVRIANEVQSMIQILRHLSGFAAWLISVGDLERAAALTIFLQEHPAIWVDTKKRTAQMLETLLPLLTSEQIERARNKSKHFTIETVMTEFLQNIPLR